MRKMRRPVYATHSALAFGSYVLVAALGIPHLSAAAPSSSSWTYFGVQLALALAYGALYRALRNAEACETAGSAGEACQGTRASREFASLLCCAATVLCGSALAAAVLSHHHTGTAGIVTLEHVLLLAAALTPPLAVIYVAGNIPYYGSTRVS